MVERRIFPGGPEDKAINQWFITNSSGARLGLVDVGAAVQSLLLPDRERGQVSVVLGYDDAEHYLHTGTSAGAICGRVANRLGDASFRLNGKTYKLPANEGKNQLHGGPKGFSTCVWQGEKQDDNSVRFHHVSPDGDMDFPGKLDVYVTYRLSDDNVISIDYEALSDADTLCNLTNHTYWNLKGYGCGDALEQKIQVFADFFTPVNGELLPTGEIAPVRNEFDLRGGRIISGIKSSADPQAGIAGGYDHNFVLRDYEPGELHRAARLEDPESGRAVEVYTDMPGMQFYSGSEKPEGHTGVAMETQHFPDAMRHRYFPSIVLRKNSIMRSRTEYRLSF